VSVTEIKQALGGWELRLREDTPRELLAALSFYGHIAVVPGQLDPLQYGDSLLTTARYVGVYRGKDSQSEFTLKGSGMAFWLGDEDDKGDVFETAVTFTGATFATAIAALLPAGGAVTAGTINAIAGTYTGKHQWQTPRKAITYVTDTFGGEWRVNGNATLDAGTVAQLYNVSPVGLLTPRGKGADLLRKALEGKLAMGVDVEDVTTRVVLLAEGSGDSIATGSANAVSVPYKDLHGNTVKATRIVSESGTESGNAAARAQLQLNRFLNARRSVQLSSSSYDVKGTFAVGDYLYVYDPANGFYDTNVEIPWEGDRINPMALRCVEMTWPVEAGWTVGFRDINGVWFDLSRWYIPEGGETTIVVGDLARGLSSVGGEPVGVRPNLPEAGADFTVPAAPTWGTFSGGSYQPVDGMWTKAAILAVWTQPLNGDASTITDGDHYELQYRVNTFIGYGVRWGQLTGYRWGALSANRWGAPITDPIDAGEWHTIFVPWGATQFQIQELTPGVEYEFRIRAVDAANPPHQGPWSTSKFYVATGDLFAPSTPAAPSVAASRIAVQVTHTLGKAAGGTFNLEPDLAFLEVHINLVSGFLPDSTTLVGRIAANYGNIVGNIPVVGTFPVESTGLVYVKVVAVDRTGNKSGASAEATSTALLIDDAHISSLTVSKVTAGTITAQWILAGSIKTAETGARVEVDVAGIRSYKSDGSQTLNVDSTTGFVDIVGRFTAQTDAGAIIRMDPVAGGDDPFMYLKASNAFQNRGHLAQFGTGSSDVTELSSKSLATDSVDGGRIWLTKTGASMVVSPEGSSIQPGVSVAGTDVTIRATGQTQITADPGSSGFVAKFLAFNSGTVVSYTPAAGTEIFIGVGFPVGNRFAGHGKMNDSFQTSDTMFYSTGIVIGSGFGAITVTYGPTMTSAVFPMYAISGASPNFSHCITVSSLTNMAVAWSDTNAHNMWLWVVRS
jgi:hypothetical protein